MREVRALLQAKPQESKEQSAQRAFDEAVRRLKTPVHRQVQASKDPNDRRLHHRVPFISEVSYQAEGVKLKRRSVDLSVGGMYIDDPQPPEEGQLIALQFELESGPLTAQATVVHSQPPFGFAVAFLGMAEADELRIEQLTSTEEPALV